MNKPGSPLQTATFVMDRSSHSDHDPARRLIVLIPAEADDAAATRRVRELAHALECHILFLGLCTDAAQESSLRRQLITMSAMVQDGNVCAEVRVKVGSNWVNAVKSDLKDGDMIVCFAEQRTGLLRKPLSQILQANLNTPVYILSGLVPQNPSRSNWLSETLGWTGSIGIIAGSFLLQIRIMSLPENWAQTTLLILSVMIEIWLIWGWNNLFG